MFVANWKHCFSDSLTNFRRMLRTFACMTCAAAEGVELTPTNAAAASISVHADDSAVFTFSFGLRSFWEFPFERRYRYDEKSVIAEIEEMSRAVLAGHCEETRGLVSVTGRIHVCDYTYKTTTIPVFRLPRFGTRRYAPYTSNEP
jgi:hypothetical protein